MNMRLFFILINLFSFILTENFKILSSYILIRHGDRTVYINLKIS